LAADLSKIIVLNTWLYHITEGIRTGQVEEQKLEKNARPVIVVICSHQNIHNILFLSVKDLI